MERPERPSRHSKNPDKWKRIKQPAADSESSSDFSSDSDTASAPPLSRPYYAQSDPTGASSSSNTHQQSLNNNNNNNTANTAQENLDRLRIRSIMDSSSRTERGTLDYSSLMARYGSKRPLDNGDSVHNYHLLHHDYAERDSYRSLPSENYPWFLRPCAGLERKRQRLLQNTSNEEPTHDDDNNREDIDNANLLYPLSISANSSRSNLPAGSGNARSMSPEDSELMRVDMECSTTTNVSPQPSNSTSRRYQELRHSSPEPFFEWERNHRYSSLRNMANPFIKTNGAKKRLYTPSPLTERGGANTSSSLPSLMDLIMNPSTANAASRSEEGADVQVISMALAGPSTSCARVLARARPKEKVACEEVIIVEDQLTTEVSADPAVEEAPQVEAKADSPPTVPPEPPLASTVTRTSTVPTEEETLNQGLIGLLECPVCMEYMSPPIHQCRRGHLVCVNCKPKLPLCPTCRSRLTDSRNLAMEKVADKLQYPCKNAHVGCGEQLRLKDKEEHEANCHFRTYRCSLPQCDWKGFKDELLKHNVAKHKDKLLYGSNHMLLLQLGDLSATTNQNWIVSTLDELFRVNFITVKSGPRIQQLFETATCRMQVFGCVQYIGPQNKAASFEYTLESKQSNGKSKRQVTFGRNTHNDLVKCSSNYSAGDSFYLRGDTAELMSEMSQGELVLVVRLSIQNSTD